MSGIYEFKLRTSKVNEAVGYSRGKVSEAPTKENLPEEDLKGYPHLLDEKDDDDDDEPSIKELTK